jgi:hypothetical protein
MEKVCLDMGIPLGSGTLIVDWMDAGPKLLPEGG